MMSLQERANLVVEAAEAYYKAVGKTDATPMGKGFYAAQDEEARAQTLLLERTGEYLDQRAGRLRD